MSLLCFMAGAIVWWLVPRAPHASGARARMVAAQPWVPMDAGWLAGGFAPSLEPGDPRWTTSQSALRDELKRYGSGSLLADRAVAHLLLDEVDQAIGRLEIAVARQPDDPAVWSDLSAAYRLRQSNPQPALASFSNAGAARRGTGGMNPFLALWAADQAVVLSKKAPLAEGRFNLALALQDLHLYRDALEAWEVVLASPLPAGWRSEAEAYRRQAEARVRHLGDGVRWREELRQALRQPLQRKQRQDRLTALTAREPVWTYLRTEVEAALPWPLDDQAAAEAPESAPGWGPILLEQAKSSADRGGDVYAYESLRHDLVAMAAASPTDRERWHRALGELKNGTVLAESRDFADAALHLEIAVQRLRELKSPLALSAEVRWLEALLNTAGETGESPERRRDEVIRRLASLRRALTARRFDGLLARTFWLEGLALGLNGNWTESLDRLDRAHGLYSTLEEPQNLAALDSLKAEARRLLGRSNAAWNERAEALREAETAADPQWLYNALADAKAAAESEGWASLAARLQANSVRLAETWGLWSSLAQAQILRAEEILAPDTLERADALLESARLALQLLPSSSLRNVLDERRQNLNRELRALRDPEFALEAVRHRLDESSRAGSRAELPDLYGRAALLCRTLGARSLQLARASGRSERDRVLPSNAERDGRQLLEQALENARRGAEEVLRQATSRRTVADRKALLDRHRKSEANLVAWLMEAGESQLALDWVLAIFEAEASGRLFVPGGGSTGLSARLSLAEDEGLLVLQTAGEKVYGWLVTGHRGAAVSFAVPGRTVQSLLRDLERDLGRNQTGDLADEGAEEGSGTSSAVPLLLSHALLGSLGESLRGLTKLILVPSEDLRKIPYAGLVSPATGRFLVEDLEISVTLPASPASLDRRFDARPLSAASPALFVGNPLNPDTLSEGLQNLKWAEQEADEGREIFPGAIVLKGPEAGKAAVLEALARVDLAHFGAHAIPGLGGIGLLLAAPPNEPNGGFLPGSEIEDLHLRLQVAVLAACRSAEPGRPAAEVEGLVEPFLAAGTRSVIASLWPVYDERSHFLWSPFYEELRKGKSPAAALREAQVNCLRQSGHDRRDRHDPNLANPTFWAGFAVYHGNLPLKGE